MTEQSVKPIPIPNAEADTAQIRCYMKPDKSEGVQSSTTAEAENITSDYKETACPWLNFQYTCYYHCPYGYPTYIQQTLTAHFQIIVYDTKQAMLRLGFPYS